MQIILDRPKFKFDLVQNFKNSNGEFEYICNNFKSINPKIANKYVLEILEYL